MLYQYFNSENQAVCKKKSINNHQIVNAFLSVGMTGFEPATSRPPDVYSNRTELHPELCVQK